MMTLPTLPVNVGDAATPGVDPKTAASALDFFALLGEALATQSGDPGAAIALERHAGLPGEAATLLTLMPDNEAAPLITLLTDDAAADGPPLPPLAQQVINEVALTMQPQAKGDAPAEPASAAAKRAAALLPDDAETDGELAALSALLAMLPQQPAPVARQATAAPATTANTPRRVTAAALPAADALRPADAPTTVSQPLAADKTAGESSGNLAPSLSALTTAASGASAGGQSPSAAPLSPLINERPGTPAWQQTVSQHITLFARQGQQSAELRLHPEELGSIHIRLKLDDNQAQLQMVSANGHVRSALEAALPVLRAQLAENGIQLGQSSISSDSFAQQQQAGRQPQQSGQGGSFNHSGDDDDSVAVPASLQASARGTGAVDIFA